ncbi:MAG: hypothetical protein JWQ17_4629 [Tardiphaga sp.]|nr:hypothetical protein [Tardiphaga sp.]
MEYHAIWVRAVRKFVFVILILLLAPIGVSAIKYVLGDRSVDWQMADRSSAGLLPPAAAHPDPVVRVYAARTVRWRGIFAVHTWIVVKERNASRYTRYDYTAWGEPIRVNGFAADGRWFGDMPQTIAAADGEAAASMIPRIQSAIEGYKLRAYGDYRAWPGPNSNTFVAAVMSAVPELRTALPPTAIGKDFPYSGEYFGVTPSGTGIRATLGGYLGLTVGWVEGLEINFLGAVFGVDIRRPAVKLPGLGRLGVSV